MPLATDFKTETLKTLKPHCHREFERNKAKVIKEVPDPMKASCCFDRGDCTDRDHWIDWRDERIELWRQHDSFALLAGEGNFLRMSMRMCNLTDSRTACP